MVDLVIQRWEFVKERPSHWTWRRVEVDGSVKLHCSLPQDSLSAAIDDASDKGFDHETDPWSVHEQHSITYFSPDNEDPVTVPRAAGGATEFGEDSSQESPADKVH
jgi:hypothetical protein